MQCYDRVHARSFGVSALDLQLYPPSYYLYYLSSYLALYYACNLPLNFVDLLVAPFVLIAFRACSRVCVRRVFGAQACI